MWNWFLATAVTFELSIKCVSFRLAVSFFSCYNRHIAHDCAKKWSFKLSWTWVWGQESSILPYFINYIMIWICGRNSMSKQFSRVAHWNLWMHQIICNNKEWNTLMATREHFILFGFNFLSFNLVKKLRIKLS